MQGVEHYQFNGFLDCGKQIFQKEGLYGYYGGVKPRLARVILDVALTFSIFGAIKRTI